MEVKFDESTHTYRNTETGELYTSATQLISKFKTLFDSKFHAERVAKREGVPVELVLESWEYEKNKSIVKGKNIHSLLENYVRFGETEKDYNWLYKAFEKQRECLVGKSKKVYAEKLLWNHEYKLAGTCDLLYEHDESFTVLDYKTNKAITAFSKYNEYLLPPVDFLSYCEYNVYALQLSIYAYMNEILTGKRIRNLHILYLTDDKFISFNVPYMKFEVQKMLEYNKEKNDK
jgi:ATP-dependent exoDNAse (exonuclease V) beta subunit